MTENEFFKSNFTIYWKIFTGLIVNIFLINIIFSDYLNIVSFTNLFLLIIPNWIITLIFNRYETNRIKKCLKNYLEKNYPDKIKVFFESNNSNIKPIFSLFIDKELLQDQKIVFLKKEAEKVIFLLVAVSAITIMFFLIATVFISKSMILGMQATN